MVGDTSCTFKLSGVFVDPFPCIILSICLWYEGFLASSTKGTRILILYNSHSKLKCETNSSSSLVSFSFFTGSDISSTLGMSKPYLALSLDNFGSNFLAWGWMSTTVDFFRGMRSYFLSILAYSSSIIFLYWTKEKSPLLGWLLGINFLGFRDSSYSFWFRCMESFSSWSRCIYSVYS